MFKIGQVLSRDLTKIDPIVKGWWLEYNPENKPVKVLGESEFGGFYVSLLDGKKYDMALEPKQFYQFVEVSEPDKKKDLKFDGDKVRHELLMEGCPIGLDGVAQVLTFGAKKYEAHSWKTLDNAVERYKGAIYRHLNAIERGEENDPESGLPHIYHVTCNALFLAELTTKEQ